VLRSGPEEGRWWWECTPWDFVLNDWGGNVLGTGGGTGNIISRGDSESRENVETVWRLDYTLKRKKKNQKARHPREAPWDRKQGGVKTTSKRGHIKKTNLWRASGPTWKKRRTEKKGTEIGEGGRRGGGRKQHGQGRAQ